MPTNEIQRQAYLNALGIQSYFPRYVLPGAQPSSTCQWPEEISNQIVREKTDPASGYSGGRENVAIRAREETALLKKSLEEKAPVKKDRIESESDPGEPLPSSAPSRYKVSFLVVDQRLAVLAHLPYTGPDNLGVRHLTLLRNMAGVLNLDMPKTGVQQIPFGWPLQAATLVDNSDNAGREALQAFLEHNMTCCGARLLLLLGEGLLECLEPDALPIAGKTVQGTGDWQACITKSLDQMLRLPEEVKPDVWRDLRKVVDLL